MGKAKVGAIYRTPLQYNKSILKICGEHTKLNSNVYIFVENGNGFEIFGRKAKKLAADRDWHTGMDIVDGNKICVLHLSREKTALVVQGLKVDGNTIIIYKQGSKGPQEDLS